MRIILFICFFLGFFELVFPQSSIFADEMITSPQNLSLEQSRDQLLKIYVNANKGKTFFYDCRFDSKGEIYENSCESVLKKDRLKNRTLVWLYGMPPFAFGKTLACWSRSICVRPNGRPFRGPSCCKEKSNRYHEMESDMHNLFPTFWKLNRARVNQEFGDIRGEKRKFGNCDIEVNRKFIEPRSKLKGDVARVYLYMSNQYEIPLRKHFEESLRMWHLMDPPDIWEIERNNFIEAKQGNRNPFIDYPKLVKRKEKF